MAPVILRKPHKKQAPPNDDWCVGCSPDPDGPDETACCGCPPEPHVDTPEHILHTLINTNRSLARLIVLAEDMTFDMLELPNPSVIMLQALERLKDEVNMARDTYFAAKRVAIKNGEFEGGYNPHT